MDGRIPQPGSTRPVVSSMAKQQLREGTLELVVEVYQKKDDDDYDWQPPSEAELKIIQARRERSDKISKLMGDYLLKGYKMLGINCGECQTILLQDKQGKNYCIACQELDGEANKDDPVTNSQAAISQIREGTVTADSPETSQPVPSPQPARSQPIKSPEPASSQFTAEISSTVPLRNSAAVSVSTGGVRTLNGVLGVNFSDTVETLCQKINWATDELRQTNNVDYIIHLCQLIRSAADAIQSVKSIS